MDELGRPSSLLNVILDFVYIYFIAATQKVCFINSTKPWLVLTKNGEEKFYSAAFLLIHTLIRHDL